MDLRTAIQVAQSPLASGRRLNAAYVAISNAKTPDAISPAFKRQLLTRLRASRVEAADA